MPQHVRTVSATTAEYNPYSNAFAPLMHPDMGWRWMLIGGIMLFLALSNQFSSRKGKLTTGRWAGANEKRAALDRAIVQLRERQKDRVTLYIGTPKYRIKFAPIPTDATRKERWVRQLATWALVARARIFTLSGFTCSYLVPDAQRGIVVLGSPGTGKTGSAIDPMIRSAIDESMSMLIYDVKGDHMRRHVAYAIEAGYEVYIFAPGFPYSGTINPLDFLQDGGDSASANEIATIINRNSKLASSKGQDDFFGPQGDQLLETVLMLAKASPYPDMLTAWKILSLPKLAKRLQLASGEHNLDLWAEVSATSLLSVADAERTVSGIVGTATITFSRFVKRDFLPSLIGKTTIPLRLDGKQIIFFQIDEKREAATAPLVASLLHMIVKHNMNNQTPRQTPMALFMDEFPSLWVPDLVNWINRFRSYGLVTVLGYQFQSQLKKTYGQDDADSIVAACATKFVFNPNHEPTAASWSKYVGKKEVVIKPRSKTHGKQHSTSQSEQYHQIDLMTADEINKMREREGLFISPGYEGGGAGSVPWHVKKFVLPEDDLLAQEQSTKLWDTKVRDRLVERAKKTQLHLEDFQLRIELLQRGAIADWQLPPPEEAEAVASAAGED
ncbi:MAG: hypothetical protein CLLPBCKN_007217 [Chroococcidiopsis cubana SAG 39.79]|uniref:Type IV secretion system coupling protein TraD DNA-binding domain-containing protein n=1 Tax=Chroococcidiopsis cubana SAG 39.79 TaxID=388085 RepID=A0AB37URS2_9CYAN|nr:type IV secretory system conjugative DNA transfer family protein [Chroococcidiopsis cubana]MDZ4877782.1 hypothetical protein [Chroococcidiopsis cubana SAG 39.79]PSB66616.1 hypothetical protein C7B79_00165 [Chroococcidiopsis cubana CCALA 043]PSB66651.1 hypothetical protein C7B79_00340 [Chroococcidiopsis cubana CCALA 043]RUT14062.1 hypothetical protein DSM107010_05450 [Chroococcidiopsis cubana SAG 39.79]